MSVYVTGDTHSYIDVGKITTKMWPESKNFTENDFLIICGDFGFIWDNSKTDKAWLKWFQEKPFITLFCDGNHENFDLIYRYPVVDYLGGKVHKINEHLYHLMRGEVYTIQGKKFFVMGGATSIDKHLREDRISWWKEELPSEDEYANALKNLENKGNKVDYIISHCAPSSIVDRLSFGYYSHDDLTNWFECKIKDNVEFSQWYFGHYHVDKVYKVDGEDKFFALYQEVVKLL